MISIKSASITDQGLGPKKAVNEDSLLVLEKEGVFSVADGVGGAQAGDIASQGALQAIKEEVGTKSEEQRSDPIVLSKTLIRVGNERVCQLAEAKQVKMASTIALVVLRGETAVLAHVGDSRIYLYREDKLLALTTDHSKLQYLLDRLPPDSLDTDNFIENNVITKALGVKPGVEPDIQKVNLRNGDLFLLCTDGVYNYNSEEEISQNLRTNSDDLNKICATLKETCYQKGAKDHLTAVVVQVEIQNADIRETIRL